MKRPEAPDVSVRPALDPSEAPDEVSRAELGRRGFLMSLGAFALAGCGAGAGQSAGGASRLLADATQTAATTTAAFVHPGLLHTQADFDRMVAKYTTNPWSASWNILIANSHASLSYKPNAQAIVYRGYDGVHPENYGYLFNDVAAAYQCALRWKISGDTAYADKAVQIMNAWSSTLTSIQGTTDAALAAGIYGYEFANAGEIMRTYSGWAAADFTAFQNMMRNVFYSINHDFLIRHNNTDVTHYWANWDLCQMASIMAIGVLCDDWSLFNEAVNYFTGGAGNGAVAQAVYYIHPGFLGQWQESGRDQGHATLGIALMGALCEMAWNQGVDLYGYDNNRFLMGAEYVAKSNLIQSGTTYYTVPYVPYNNVDNVQQNVFSTNSQGTPRPCWALVYNHYVNRKGLAAPYSKQFALVVQPEGGGGNYGSTSGGYDQLGYGTLTCTRDPIASGAAPSGLKARAP
ncbi:MAG: alginate lyase family protein, partial [Massilia sp.]|nr:alginate lyase family protein [Massilia sp.]